jgi:hypothetical protein
MIQEMKMATLTFSNALLPLAGTDKAETTEATSPGFFNRAFKALVASRQRSAEREIARIEMMYGFSLTGKDELSLKVDSSELPFGK